MSRTIGALKTTVSLEDAQFQQSMAGVQRQLRGLKQETRAVTSSGTGFARGVDEMRAKADVLTRTLEVQDAQVKELRRAYEQSKKETGANSKETQEAATAYNKARAEMNRTENQLKFLTEEVERQTNPWNRLSENMDVAGKNIQNFGRGMTEMGKSMTTRITLPILGLGAGILKVGMDFEAGMSQVQALTQATEEDMFKLTDQAKELGESTRFSATEAADAMGFLGMAGFETTQILETMPGLLDLAASSNMDLGRAADIATNILSGFSMEADEAGRIADILAAGASSANTDVAQLGDAMKYAAPIASTLNMEIEGLTASVGFMSDSGIQGSQAGRQLRQGLLRLAKPTGDAADLIEELGIEVFDSDENMKDMHEVVAELEKGLDGMGAQAKTSALSIIFGSDSTAGWSALLEEGSSALKDYTKELENSEGAAKEMAEIMQDNAKGAMIEFKSATEGIAISLAEHMIPTVTNIIEKGTDLVRKFGELDESQQQNIIKAGLFAAALGPVAMVAGNLTTALGGIVRGGGSLIRMLGGTGGLIARLGTLAGPAGIAIVAAGGLAYLGYKISEARKESEKLNEVSTESADKLWEQADALGGLAESFEDLERKSKLTNDEFGRMIDLQQEIEKTSNPGKLAELVKEYEDLQEKSGLSNDEIEEMIALNNEIIDQSPGVEKTFTDKGNAIIESTDAVRKYIDSLRDMAWIELEQERFKAMENEQKILIENREIKEQIKSLDEEWHEIQKLSSLSEDERLERLKKRLNEVRYEMRLSGTTQEEINQLKDEEEIILSMINDGLAAGVDKIQEQRDELTGKLGQNEEELAKLDVINERMAEILLHEVDINYEQGEGLSKLDDRIDKLKDERQSILDNMTEEEKRSGIHDKMLEDLDLSIHKHEGIRNQIREETGYQSEQNAEIEKQNKGLDITTRSMKGILQDQRELNQLFGIGTGEAKEMNRELGSPINKYVRVDDNGSINSLTREAQRPLTKRVTLSAAWSGVQTGLRNALSWLPGFASGTDYAPGGLAVVGEEGFELARYNDNWGVLGHGIADIPRGTEIFTHDQSKRILRSLNSIPKFAQGTNMGAETNRITRNQAVDINDNSVYEFHLEIPLDGREFVKRTITYTAAELESLKRDERRRRG